MKLINPNIGPSIKPLIMQGIQVGAHRQVPYRTTQHRKHFDNTKIFLITDTLQEKKQLFKVELNLIKLIMHVYLLLLASSDIFYY